MNKQTNKTNKLVSLLSLTQQRKDRSITTLKNKALKIKNTKIRVEED